MSLHFTHLSLLHHYSGNMRNSEQNSWLSSSRDLIKNNETSAVQWLNDPPSPSAPHLDLSSHLISPACQLGHLLVHFPIPLISLDITCHLTSQINFLIFLLGVFLWHNLASPHPVSLSSLLLVLLHPPPQILHLIHLLVPLVVVEPSLTAALIIIMMIRILPSILTNEFPLSLPIWGPASDAAS